jgi:spore coat polysaccharide biosynthesis protein SpsF (cytidylyltransferase family)
VVGDQVDVLSRLVNCGLLAGATDVFRVTSESPFLYFDPVEELWRRHQVDGADASFLDDVIDGCGFEIISLKALQESLDKGEKRHRSELCTLYIRENHQHYRIIKADTPPALEWWCLRSQSKMALSEQQVNAIWSRQWAKIKPFLEAQRDGYEAQLRPND